jgi:hypothetical protein
MNVHLESMIVTQMQFVLTLTENTVVLVKETTLGMEEHAFVSYDLVARIIITVNNII